MRVEYVPARMAHIESLVEHMRDRERRAFEMTGLDPYRTLEREIAYSHMAFTGLVDGQPVALAGVRAENMLSDVAYIWMVGTCFIDAYPVAFFRHTRRFVIDLRRSYGTLYCWADPSFGESCKWLQWLGFKTTGSWNGAVMFRT